MWTRNEFELVGSMNITTSGCRSCSSPHAASFPLRTECAGPLRVYKVIDVVLLSPEDALRMCASPSDYNLSETA